MAVEVEVELHRKINRACAAELARYHRLREQGVFRRLRWYVADATAGTTARRALPAAGFPRAPRGEVKPLSPELPVSGRRGRAGLSLSPHRRAPARATRRGAARRTPQRLRRGSPRASTGYDAPGRDGL